MLHRIARRWCKPVRVHVRSVLLPDDCYLHETLSCNKGFEVTYFYAWLIGLDQLCLICGTLSTFAVKKELSVNVYVMTYCTVKLKLKRVLHWSNKHFNSLKKHEK